MSVFDAVNAKAQQTINNAHNAIVQDAEGDTTDPEVLIQMKYDIDKYSTAMQFSLGIENALQSLRKAIVQSLGQA